MLVVETRPGHCPPVIWIAFFKFREARPYPLTIGLTLATLASDWLRSGASLSQLNTKWWYWVQWTTKAFPL